jgi:hypothetical protein
MEEIGEYMKMQYAKKISRPVTPAQAKFATGLSRAVKMYVNVNGPKLKKK